MSIQRRNVIHSAAIATLFLLVSTTIATAQTQTTRSNGLKTDTAISQAKSVPIGVPAANADNSTAGHTTKRITDDPKLDDVQDELNAIKAENAAVREMLQKMQEQQKTLLETVERLQQRLDDPASATSLAQRRLAGTPDTDSTTAPIADDGAMGSKAGTELEKIKEEAAKASLKQSLIERYQEGIVIWQTPDDAKVPFLLRFNNNTQFRYLNTLGVNDTFTDHLGNVREVKKRNDLTVNRAMFILGGYIWDKRLKYSLTVWTSAGSASIVVAGNIGWQFNKHLTLTGGYFGVPGSRSLVNTFPYFAAMDRSMADNFFRPAFTQGIQANGELTKNWHYLVQVANGLNTLNISAAKIDTNLALSGSTWWEPLGAYAPAGKSVNMYDDYFSEKKLRIRLGTSFTRSREDRFSNLDVTSPENTSLYNSDGVLTFSTGAFAPGLTVDKATYKMWATDWGMKYDGLAINGQYYLRWINDFEADGPMPLDSTFDHGFEMSVGKFVIPKKLEIYGRGSYVFGYFNDSWEVAGGFKWHFLPTERLWLQGEMVRIERAPYSGTFTPYTAGMTGWFPMIQTIIAF